MVDEEEETGINVNVNVNDNGNDDAWYDLSGRKVNSQSSILNSQLPKGIYVHNGRKEVVRWRSSTYNPKQKFWNWSSVTSSSNPP